MADLTGSDQFAVYNGSTHKKITADQLSQNYDGSYANYRLAVYNSSNGNHYSVKCNELGSKISSSNQGSYHFMISRGSTLYKVAAEKVLGLLSKMWSVNWKNASTGGTGVQIYDTVPNNFGEVYVIGVVGAASNNSEAFVAMLDSSGSVVWQRKIGGSGYERGMTGVVDSSGNISIAAWTSTSTVGSYDLFFASYNRSGSVLYRTKVGSSNFEIPKTMMRLPNGNFVVAAQWVSTNSYAVYFELNSNLSRSTSTTSRRINMPPSWNAGAECGAVDNSGNIYIGGSGPDLSGISNGYEGIAFITKITNGNHSWSRAYTSPAPPNIPSGRNITLGSIAIVNGNEPVSLISEQMRWVGGNYTTAIIKYDTNGNFSWYRRITDPEGFDSNDLNNNGTYAFTGDLAHSIDTDSSNNIYFVTSSGMYGANLGTLVVKINYSGTLIWARKISYTNTTINLVPRSLHVDQKENLIVGTSDMVLALSTDGDFTGIYGSGNTQYQISNYSIALTSSMIGSVKTKSSSVSNASIPATTSASNFSSSSVSYSTEFVEI